MDRPGQGLRHFLTKLCNGSFISVNEKLFRQKKKIKLMLKEKGPKWQNGYFLPNSHFGTFVPVHGFQKFFWSNDFSSNVMKDLLHTFAQKVSQALSRAIHAFTQYYFKFPCWIGSWDDSGRLGTRIGMGVFFWYLYL